MTIDTWDKNHGRIEHIPIRLNQFVVFLIMLRGGRIS